MITQVQFQCFGVQCQRCEQWIALMNLAEINPQDIGALRVPALPVLCPQCYHQRVYPPEAGKLLLGFPEKWGSVIGAAETPSYVDHGSRIELKRVKTRQRSKHHVPPNKLSRPSTERRV